MALHYVRNGINKGVVRVIEMIRGLLHLSPVQETVQQYTGLGDAGFGDVEADLRLADKLREDVQLILRGNHIEDFTPRHDPDSWE